jgi:hypothetical protein
LQLTAATFDKTITYLALLRATGRLTGVNAGNSPTTAPATEPASRPDVAVEGTNSQTPDVDSRPGGGKR